MNQMSISYSVTSDTDPYNQLPELEISMRQVILTGLGVGTVGDVKKRLPENPRIFIRPNWVYDRPSRKKDNFASMVTHKSIVLTMVSILEELQPKEIIIGNSPVQECVFENIVINQPLILLSNIIDKIKIETQSDISILKERLDRNLLRGGDYLVTFSLNTDKNVHCDLWRDVIRFHINDTALGNYLALSPQKNEGEWTVSEV